MPTERCFELLSLPGWSRAESLKMLFYLADQPFFDHRITINEWKIHKAKMCLPPEVRLPILRVDNYSIIGTLEIGRYLSRQFGFYANSTIEQAQIEEILGYVETLHLAFLPIIRATFQRDAKKRMFHWQEFNEKTLAPVLEFLSQRLGQNDYFVANRLTFADVSVSELFGKFSTLCDPQLALKYPLLAAHLDRVEEPKLKEYVSQRSRTIF